MAEIVQVINGDGQFEQECVERFVEDIDLAACKTDYQVVAIMGPQSSGKSTLLNCVFGTNFAMMDAMYGRGQTTKGIWVSKSPKVTETSLLVMDLEGSDGRERGEDDTNFERQSALFALAVADVLLVNIWCHDIGREHGSGKPLLKTIFQVNLKLFSPEPDRKRTVLLFVIRDKTKTPVSKLVEVLAADLERMWDSIAKPAAYMGSKLTDFFEVQYAALSHFEERYEDFVAEATYLRRRFSPDSEDTLLRGVEKLPGDSFALSIRNIWDVIRAQKDLNLPAHKVMVANIRCQEILEDQLRSFTADQAWNGLREAAGSGVVEGFGQRAQWLVDSCIKGYQAEALYFDASVQEAKFEELYQRLMAILQPVYRAQVAAHQGAIMSAFERDIKLATMEAKGGKKGHADFVVTAEACRAAATTAFANAYDKHLRIEGSLWDGITEQLIMAEVLDAHISRVRAEQVEAARVRVEKQLTALISGPVMGLLEVCAPGTWPKLHKVCQEAAAVAEKNLMQLLDGYDVSQAEASDLADELRAKASECTEGHVREASHTRLSRMKDRFQEVFSQDENKAPRMWSARDDIPAIAQQARMAAASVLAQLAVMRPKQTSSGEQDTVEMAVMQLARSSTSSNDGKSEASTSASTFDMLSTAVWPDMDDEQVLLQPHDIRSTWREFMSYSNVLVQQALSAQQANRLAGNRMPPLWAMAALLVLGWNEAMAVLFNPVYLVLTVLAAFFLRTLYVELDVEREMAAGALPGALRLSHRFVPACQSVMQKTLDALLNMIPQSDGENTDDRSAAYSLSTALHQDYTEGLTRRSMAGAPESPLFTDIMQEGKKDQ